MSDLNETADRWDQQVQADAELMLGIPTTRPVTGKEHGQLAWSMVKMRELQKEETILLPPSQINYGSAEKANPFDAKAQTLSEYNKNVQQLNGHVPFSLSADVKSATDQGKMVQKYFGGSTRVILNELSSVTVNQYILDTSGLLQIDDPIQMALILKRTIMTDTLSLIEQMCKNLPLQGNFWLSARQAPFSSENELYLDLTTLSMHRFQALLALISAQLNSSKKGKPTNLLELAKAKACEMIDGLLRVNLLDFQDQQKLAEYQVSLKSWYNPSTDSALSALMADDVQSKQVCARAWQHLTSQKGPREF